MKLIGKRNSIFFNIGCIIFLSFIGCNSKEKSAENILKADSMYLSEYFDFKNENIYKQWIKESWQDSFCNAVFIKHYPFYGQKSFSFFIKDLRTGKRFLYLDDELWKYRVNQPQFKEMFNGLNSDEELLERIINNLSISNSIMKTSCKKDFIKSLFIITQIQPINFDKEYFGYNYFFNKRNVFEIKNVSELDSLIFFLDTNEKILPPEPQWEDCVGRYQSSKSKQYDKAVKKDQFQTCLYKYSVLKERILRGKIFFHDSVKGSEVLRRSQEFRKFNIEVLKNNKKSIKEKLAKGNFFLFYTLPDQKMFSLEIQIDSNGYIKLETQFLNKKNNWGYLFYPVIGK